MTFVLRMCKILYSANLFILWLLFCAHSLFRQSRVFIQNKQFRMDDGTRWTLSGHRLFTLLFCASLKLLSRRFAVAVIRWCACLSNARWQPILLSTRNLYGEKKVINLCLFIAVVGKKILIFGGKYICHCNAIAPFHQKWWEVWLSIYCSIFLFCRITTALFESTEGEKTEKNMTSKTKSRMNLKKREEAAPATSSSSSTLSHKNSGNCILTR